MSDWPKHTALEGRFAALMPLSPDHADDLAEAAGDGDLAGLWYTTVPKPKDIPTEIDRRNSLRDMRAFAVVDPATDRAVGMTTYMNIDAVNKRVEIGSTWYRKSAQRTGINTQCKLLLLTHAFDVLGCNAVEFRTHFMNQQSRTAIERLGAKLDGVLRNHMVMDNGSMRDTCVYSILPHEWPAVRANLEHKLRR